MYYKIENKQENMRRTQSFLLLQDHITLNAAIVRLQWHYTSFMAWQNN